MPSVVRTPPVGSAPVSIDTPTPEPAPARSRSKPRLGGLIGGCLPTLGSRRPPPPDAAPLEPRPHTALGDLLKAEAPGAPEPAAAQASRPQGPLGFKHRDRWKLAGQAPDVTVTPTLAAAPRALLGAIKRAFGARQAPSDAASVPGPVATPFPVPSIRLPKVMLKRKGEIKVGFSDEVSRADRKVLDPMRRAVQGTLRRLAGEPCTGATPHAGSAGTLVHYRDGAMRWVGSASAAVPLAVYNVLQTPDADGDAGHGLKPPPVELLTGVTSVQGEAAARAEYRLHEGALYRFQPGTRDHGAHWVGCGGAEEMRRQASGVVCVRQGDQLRVLGPDGPGEVALSGVAGWQSVQLLPSALAGPHRKVVGVDRQGRAVQMRAGRPPEPLPLPRGVVDLLPAGDSLLARTATGDLLALRRDERGRWQPAPDHALTQPAQALPLGAGHRWQVQATGFSPDAEGRSQLHALMVSDQGHRCTATWDGTAWKAQYAADGLEIVAQDGLASKPVRPGSELHLDLDTTLAIGADGSLCHQDPATQRHEALLDANGQPLRGLKKIALAAGGLQDGKTVLALMERDGRTEVCEIPISGRTKALPADATRSWTTGRTPWMQAERLGLGQPVTRLVQRSQAPEDELVDLGADTQGRSYGLTRGGQVVLAEQAAAASQVPWPRETAPLAKAATEQTLPAVRIDGQDLQVRQLAVSGDQGRLLALAQAPGEPLRLVEHRPGQDGAEGTWHAVPLQRPDSISDAQWAAARLSTSLLGTPVIEVDGSEGPRRLRLLQRGATPADPKAPPPPHLLVDASLSGEDPRVAMDRNDAWRVKVPGTQATVRQTWLGTAYNAVNNRPPAADAGAAGKVAHYAAFPFKSVYEHAVDGVRLLQVPFMAAKRAKQDLWGRQDLRCDYATVGQAMRSLRELTPPFDEALAARVRSAAALPTPPSRREPLQAADALGQDALAHCRKMLEEMCITARVLQPDRVSERSPGWRRKLQSTLAAPLNQLTPGSQDGLPKIRAFFDELARPQVGGILPEGEREQIDHIRHLAGLLQRHGVQLWDGQRGKLSNFTAYHGSHAIAGAALATSMDVYRQVARERAQLQASPDAAVTAAEDADAAAALATLKTQAERLQDDRSITLARCGFSGWAGLEAFYESVHELRAQASASRGPSGVASQLYRMMERDLDLPPRDKLGAEELQALVPQKYAETVASLQPRSTYFWMRSATAGIGANLGVGSEHKLSKLLGKQLPGVGLGGNATLLGWRKTGVGVEALGNGDGTGQGPIIAFFVRAGGTNANANVTASGSAPPVPKKVRDFSAFAAAGAGWDETRARGVGMVLPPDKLQEFARRLFDTSVEPTEILKLGVNEGGIGLNLQERSVALPRGTFGVGERPPLGGRHPNAFGPDDSLSAGATGGGGISLAVALEKRAMALRLRLGFLPGGGIGDERQGAFGATAALAATVNLPANLAEARTTRDPSALVTSATAPRGLFEAAGATLNAAWQPTYKRTNDFVRAEHVNQDSWDNLLHHLRQVHGLSLPMPPGTTPDSVATLDVTTAAGRSTMRACLQTWTDHLRQMEAAFMAHAHGQPLDEHQRTLLAQAQSVDEFGATRLMLNGRRLLQQSAAAERGVALLEPSARIEFNLPFQDPTAADTTAHSRLGPAMAEARRAEAEIDGLTQVKRGNTRLPGFNQTRAVLTMHPRVVDLCNELIAFGLTRRDCEREGIPWPSDLPAGTERLHFSYHDVCRLSERNPQNYGQVVIGAKNNEANAKTTSWTLGVPLAQSTIIAEERFLSEAAVRETGWGGRLLGAEVLPSGQGVLRRPTQPQRQLANLGYRVEPPPGQPQRHTPSVNPLDQVLQPSTAGGLADASAFLQKVESTAQESAERAAARTAAALSGPPRRDAASGTSAGPSTS